MATKKPAVAIALKHVDTTGIELKQIIGPPKDQDHKRRSLNTSIQRASHVPPTAAPFVPLVSILSEVETCPKDKLKHNKTKIE